MRNSLRYPFPFEGNWNNPKVLENVPMMYLAIRFPVWRELKHCFNERRGGYGHGTCHTLSRLKGIETWKSEQRASEFYFFLAIPFPVWRELKHDIRRNIDIDTFLLRYAFPFEGNWNHDFVVMREKYLFLAIRFPVWRELKRFGKISSTAPLPTTCDTLSRLKGIET